MTDRVVLALTGSEREKFLQGLVTNDVRRAAGGIIYAALLTPQGKFICDFFVMGQPDRLLIDVGTPAADDLQRRLTMYRLRADVQITRTDLTVARGLKNPPPGALTDPRDARLGWRAYDGAPSTPADWDALRVALSVPEAGAELTPDSYILEMGFERLHGVDFRKGCYVGQEVTARMKHKTDLRKGLARVAVTGAASPGTPILMADGREAGMLYTRSGDHALAYLRFDRAEGPLTAGGCPVTLLPES
jgi:tRNA-modifying protein YgfZ